jgi:DNA polymerase-3 subunit alpha
MGKMWASAILEDLAGSIEVLFFPNTYELMADRLAEDLIVAIKGRVNRRDTGPLAVAVTDMRVLEIGDDTNGRPLTIRTREPQVTEAWAERLKEILTRHQGGTTEVRIQMGRHLLRLRDHSVDVTPALMSDLKAFVGAGNLT